MSDEPVYELLDSMLRYPPHVERPSLEPAVVSWLMTLAEIRSLPEVVA